MLLTSSGVELQPILDLLQIYSAVARLTLNLKKTKVLVIKDTSGYKLQYNGSLLERVEQLKYLGLVLDKSGKFLCLVQHCYANIRSESPAWAIEGYEPALKPVDSIFLGHW